MLVRGCGVAKISEPQKSMKICFFIPEMYVFARLYFFSEDFFHFSNAKK